MKSGIQSGGSIAFLTVIGIVVAGIASLRLVVLGTDT